MSEYYNVVPWFNSNEWNYVYNKAISSALSEKQEALNALFVWKARCPSLPAGIESTLTLLEVQIQDLKNTEVCQDQLLRLAYSSAIMRFVNHMLDSEAARGSSLYQAAKNLGVPDWIIDLRHDTAHSNNLPTIELLREATSLSLHWLQINYWDKYKEHIADYVTCTKQINYSDENEFKISILMNLCLSLSFCASNSKIKNVAEIPDEEMRNSIVKDVLELYGKSCDLSKLKSVSLSSLINMTKTQTISSLLCKDVCVYVNKTLLGPDSMFFSAELLNLLNDNLLSKNRLSKQYLESFRVLLTFLHSRELLLEFILELVKISQNTSNGEDKCLLAGLWTSEILKALNRSKQFHERIEELNVERNSKNSKELQDLFYHWFPNEKNGSLLLDLEKPVPAELSDIKFIQPIISSYNPYLTFYVRDLLNLLEPSLPNNTIQQICHLAQLIASPEGISEETTRIYSLDDLKVSQHEADSNSDCMEILDEGMETDVINEKKVQNSQGIWSLSSTEHNWSSCPIGLLPWQDFNKF